MVTGEQAIALSVRAYNKAQQDYNSDLAWDLIYDKMEMVYRAGVCR